MKTNQSLEKEGYRLVLDGGILAIVFLVLVAAMLDCIVFLMPELMVIYAPISTLAVGVVFGMMISRIAPIWIKQDKL